jgi:hypothetical protein
MKRNLRTEASAFCGPCQLVRVKENRASHRARSIWAAWDVHVKDHNTRAGRCLVTLIHLAGTKFEVQS